MRFVFIKIAAHGSVKMNRREYSVINYTQEHALNWNLNLQIYEGVKEIVYLSNTYQECQDQFGFIKRILYGFTIILLIEMILFLCKLTASRTFFFFILIMFTLYEL